MKRTFKISQLYNKPFIRFNASYLMKYGFFSGNKIKVKFSKNKIVIKNETENFPSGTISLQQLDIFKDDKSKK